MPRADVPPTRACAAILAAAAAFAPSQHARADADVYRFDPVHSQVWFTTDHQGFSRPIGRLRVGGGWFRFDPGDWSRAELDVVVDLASVDLGDAKWNDTVKSAQFLDVARWPRARYVGRGAEAKDATHAILHGELDFRGRKLPLDLAIELNRLGTDPYAFRHKAGFGATATLSRAAFGMTRYKDVVADAVTIHVQVEGVRDRGADRRPDGVEDHAEE